MTKLFGPFFSSSDSPRHFVSRLGRGVGTSLISSTENDARINTSTSNFNDIRTSTSNTNFNDICGTTENDIWQCLNADSSMSVPKNLNLRKAFKDER